MKTLLIITAPLTAGCMPQAAEKSPPTAASFNKVTVKGTECVVGNGMLSCDFRTKK